jgi:ATP-dependent protease ClpP protease subunit
MRNCREKQNETVQTQIVQQNENEFYTEYHSLFIDKIDAVEGVVALTMEDGKVQNITCALTPKHDEYTLYVTDFVSEGSENHQLIHKLNLAEDNDELTVRISSNGGAITEGIQFYNSFKKNFRNRTTTIIDSHAYSMGAVMFCFGNKRVAPEHISFMFHDWQGASWGNGGNVAIQSEHSNKWIDNFFDTVIVKNGYLTPKEFKAMKDGKEHWFTVQDLAERGIATHIEVDGVEVDAKDYLEYKKSKKDVHAFLAEKIEQVDGE